jgi:hypothetical protein
MKNLKQAAAERKTQHDYRVKPDNLKVGDLVLLRSHPLGRKKMQDHWKPEKFRVKGVPDCDGAPVVVEPVLGGDVKFVSRQEIKRCEIPVPKPRTKPVHLPEFQPQESVRSNTDVPESESSDSSDSAERLALPRRTTRVGAGRHSNVNKLPRAVRETRHKDIASQMIQTFQIMLEKVFD